MSFFKQLKLKMFFLVWLQIAKTQWISSIFLNFSYLQIHQFILRINLCCATKLCQIHVIPSQGWEHCHNLEDENNKQKIIKVSENLFQPCKQQTGISVKQKPTSFWCGFSQKPNFFLFSQILTFMTKDASNFTHHLLFFLKIILKN